MLSNLIADVRLGARTLLARNPGFALTAAITLALGIGLSTAVFTVADSALLRRLPVTDQNRLVVLFGAAPDRHFDYPLLQTDASDLARASRTLEASALFLYNGAIPLAIREGNDVSRLNRAMVSGEFFGVLGARAALGRTLDQSDDHWGAESAVVLSHRAWRTHFNSDPHVIGRRVTSLASGATFTVVGVMPDGLDYPKGVDFWAALNASMPPSAVQLMSFFVLGRLKQHATPAAAASELTAFFTRADAPAWQRKLRGTATPLPQLIAGDVGPALLAFSFASALLLLIACVNVANLLLVRGKARAREIAVRSALGASRSRLVSQLLTENSVLAVTGTVFGVAVAYWSLQALVAFAPTGFLRLGEMSLNGRALLAATGLMLLAVMAFSVVPLVVTSHIDIERTLRSDSHASAGRGHRVGMEALVVAQLSIALVILSGAGILLRTMVNLEQVNLSLNATGLLVGDLALSDLYANAASQHQLLDKLIPEIQGVRGVESVSPVVAPPFAGAGGWDGKPRAEGQSSEEAARNPMLNMDVVGPSYFATLGAPILRGRGFTAQDREDAPHVVVLSQTAAQNYWPNENPIGKRLLIGPDAASIATVVGVVGDTRYRDLRDARPSVYFPLDQSAFPFVPTSLVIRVTGDPNQVIPVIRRAVSQAEPGVSIANLAPFDTFLEGPLAQPRLNAVLLTIFALAAVVLAAVGLFGAMATMVRQRTQELGIRLALGATPAELRRMVALRGLTIGAVGVALGLLGSLAANRVAVGLLYNVAPTDLTALLGAAGVLLAVVLLASEVPARRSMRTDPLTALRAE